jgi:hypothetical protein
MSVQYMNSFEVHQNTSSSTSNKRVTALALGLLQPPQQKDEHCCCYCYCR